VRFAQVFCFLRRALWPPKRSLPCRRPPPALPKIEARSSADPAGPRAATPAAAAKKLKVTPPHIVDLQEKLRDHPSQQRAEQRVCEAKWNILLGKSNYYPRLNATLSGGSKWIDQSSRADEFGGSNSSEYDGEGLNATLSLRQHIYDWGRNASIITGHRQDRFVAQIERQATLEQQLSSLSSMALDYVLQVRLIDHFMDSQKIIDRDVNSMEQRFKAGAARLAEMRQARLTGLEIESRLTQAQRQRDLVAQEMKTQFGILPAQAVATVESFQSNRPDVPTAVAGEASPRARLIRHNIKKVESENTRLRAERLPSFTGVVTARGWDVDQKNRCNDPIPRRGSSLATSHEDIRGSTRLVDKDGNGGRDRDEDGNFLYYRVQNCSTYEMTGAIEFSMPLYDGGANAAQRGGVSAQRMGLEAELAAYQRSHNAESRRLQDQLLDELTQLAEKREQLDQLETQIASERLLSTRTRGNLLGLLGLEQKLADTRAQYISLQLRSENTRIEALQLAGQLADVLDVSLGVSGC
jgi:outer membrane protein TolC